MKISIIPGLYRFKSMISHDLNRVAIGWSGKKLKFICILFVLTGMTLSLFITLEAIEHPRPLDVFPKPRTNVYPLPSTLPHVNPLWSAPLLAKVKAIRIYLDSLAMYDKNKYKALVKSQPLFLDSLLAIEKQLSKKIK